MAPTREYRNIALVGFMGAGKSTVGHLLAEILAFEFIDTDRVIELRQNRRVADIFEKDGEPFFRALERDLCRELESSANRVIATGGGMPVDPSNAESLRGHCLVVCLWASPETLYERVRHQSHRPLLQEPDPLARIRSLLVARTPAYRQSDILVGVDFRAPLDTARQIATSFRRARGPVMPARAPRA